MLKDFPQDYLKLCAVSGTQSFHALNASSNLVIALSSFELSLISRGVGMGLLLNMEKKR